MNKEPIDGLYENGLPKIVEIDESLFFKRKYNRDRIRYQSLYVGGIERGTSNIFIEEIERRDAYTLSEVINRNIRPFSKIITD